MQSQNINRGNKVNSIMNVGGLLAEFKISTGSLIIYITNFCDMNCFPKKKRWKCGFGWNKIRRNNT